MTDDLLASSGPRIPAATRTASSDDHDVESSDREWAQFECFRAISRGNRTPVLSMTGNAVMLNQSARDLDLDDQAALFRMMPELQMAGHGAVCSVDVGHPDAIQVRIHTRSDDVRFPGLVLEVLS